MNEPPHRPGHPDRDRRPEPQGEPYPADGTPFDLALWQIRHRHNGTPRGVTGQAR